MTAEETRKRRAGGGGALAREQATRVLLERGMPSTKIGTEEMRAGQRAGSQFGLR